MMACVALTVAWTLGGRSKPSYALGLAYLLLAAAGLAAHFGHQALSSYLVGAGTLPRALLEPVALVLATSALVVGARGLLDDSAPTRSLEESSRERIHI